MTGNHDNLGRVRLFQLAHEVDAFAIRETQIGQKHVGTLPAELDPRFAQGMRAPPGSRR